jgi:hypothetical protein
LISNVKIDSLTTIAQEDKANVISLFLQLNALMPFLRHVQSDNFPSFGGEQEFASVVVPETADYGTGQIEVELLAGHQLAVGIQGANFDCAIIANQGEVVPTQVFLNVAANDGTVESAWL